MINIIKIILWFQTQTISPSTSKYDVRIFRGCLDFILVDQKNKNSFTISEILKYCGGLKMKLIIILRASKNSFDQKQNLLHCWPSREIFWQQQKQAQCNPSELSFVGAADPVVEIFLLFTSTLRQFSWLTSLVTDRCRGGSELPPWSRAYFLPPFYQTL